MPSAAGVGAGEAGPVDRNTGQPVAGSKMDLAVSDQIVNQNLQLVVDGVMTR